MRRRNSPRRGDLRRAGRLDAADDLVGPLFRQVDLGIVAGANRGDELTVRLDQLVQ